MRVTEPYVSGGVLHAGSSVGQMLRAAREQAGMSLEDVAGQLKLAPRQIRALEEEAYDQLPSKAFVRGFIRNYARLLHVDADALMNQMEAPSVSPEFGEPIAPSRGELPQQRDDTKHWRIWALPAILLAVVAVGAYYEWQKPRSTPNGMAPAVSPVALPTSSPDLLPPPARVDTPSDNVPAATSVPSTAGDVQSPAPPAPPVAPATPSSGAVQEAAKQTASGADKPPSVAQDKSTAKPVAKNAMGRIDLVFAERSWVHIRDHSGETLLVQNAPAGSHHSVSGTPPFTVVVGNVRGAKLTYNGKAVNLARYQSKSIARLTLN